ncbi:MAG: hypothetical protein IKV94_02035 [Clostridia bacterium]|nr:hypothetical protein [Clostridia bacterium]
MKKIILSLIVVLSIVMVSSSLFASEIVQASNIPNGTYIIGTHSFNRGSGVDYDGTLTLKHIMKAAKTIEGDDLDDMVIYYKNGRGKWVDPMTDQEITSSKVPTEFEILYENNAVYIKEPEIEIKGWYKETVVYISHASDVERCVLEYSVNGNNYYVVDSELVHLFGAGMGKIDRVHNLSEYTQNVSFRAKVSKLDSEGNEIYSEYSKVVTYVVKGDMSKEDITAIGLPDNDHAVVVNSDYTVEIEQKAGEEQFKLMDKTKYQENAYGVPGVTRCPTNMEIGIVYEYRARIVVEKENETIYSAYTEPIKWILGDPVLEIDSTYSAIVDTDEGKKRKIFIDVTDTFEGFNVAYKFESDSEWIGYPSPTILPLSDKTLELVLPENYEKCHILIQGFVKDINGNVMDSSSQVEVIDDIYEMTPNVVIDLDEDGNYVVTATKNRDIRSMALGLDATRIIIEESIDDGEFVPVVLTDKSSEDRISSSEPVWAKYECERDGKRHIFRAIIVHSQGVTSGYSKPQGSLG